MLTFAKPKFLLNPRPDLEHWWAVVAMIASYNHVYQVIYNTSYEVYGPIGVSIYGDTPTVSLQYEFLAVSTDTKSVIDAVRNYPMLPRKQKVYL